MHWSSEIVKALKDRGDRHVIETGTSISGIPHVGNASDVIRGDAVRKACLASALEVDLIWVADDSDPFRKVPLGMDGLKEYLGYPVKDIPDPDGCHKSFVDHFVEPFMEDLESFGVKPVKYSGTDLYRNKDLNNEIKIAFEKKEKITEILNKYRREPLPVDYVPWTPICGGCGRISTTRVTGLDGLKVSYVCESTDVSGGRAEGCSHEGVSDALNGEGKLPWRVEWAARWHHFKVTCEPFGKEHATQGGSYDTSKIISSEVFEWQPPYPVVYEFFTLNKDKISSSKGNVITLGDWLKMAEPEVLKFFMYKRLKKQRDINLATLPSLVDEYDVAENSFYKKTDPVEDLNEMYDLSQVEDPSYLNVPFTLCAVLSQIIPEPTEDILDERISAMGYTGYDKSRLLKRVVLAGIWANKWGPEYLRFKLTEADIAEKNLNHLDDNQRKALQELSRELGKKWIPQDLHKRIYDIARSNDLNPPELFKAIYQVLIGKEKGPKAAMFLLTLEKEFVVKRLSTD